MVKWLEEHELEMPSAEVVERFAQKLKLTAAAISRHFSNRKRVLGSSLALATAAKASKGLTLRQVSFSGAGPRKQTGSMGTGLKRLLEAKNTSPAVASAFAEEDAKKKKQKQKKQEENNKRKEKKEESHKRKKKQHENVTNGKRKKKKKEEGRSKAKLPSESDSSEEGSESSWLQVSTQHTSNSAASTKPAAASQMDVELTGMHWVVHLNASVILLVQCQPPLLHRIASNLLPRLRK